MPYQKRKSIDFARLQDLIPPFKVLQLLCIRTHRERCGTYRGPCPLHRSSSDQSRTFACRDSLYFCFKCKAHGDAVGLYARLQGLSNVAAARELCERLNVPIPYLEG